MDVELREETPAPEETLRLYAAVGWSAYTEDPDRLIRALSGSHRVITARTDEDELIGLVRTVSDAATIVYVQDLLVDPAHHRHGVGSRLLDAVQEGYRDVRQLVLLTDDEPAQAAFYTSCGLVETRDVTPRPLRAFVRLT